MNNPSKRLGIEWGDISHLFPDLPYHNLEHTKGFNYSTAPNYISEYAAMFHDIGYDPKAKNNEEKACQTFDEVVKHLILWDNHHTYQLRQTQGAEYNAEIKRLIMSTKDHPKYFDPADESMWWLHFNDLAYLRERDFGKIVKTEMKIFKEYQFTPWKEYQKRRIELLRYYASHPLTSEQTIDTIISFLSTWEPKIGIFAGSFNPMHIGHLDIIRQAERVFDKVIIAQGQNLEKEANEANLIGLQTIKYHEKTKYEGSLFAFLNKMQQDHPQVSLIRGLRNNDDLEHETIIWNFQKAYTTVPAVYFIADSSLRHISSGAIKQLKTVGQPVDAYLVK